MELAHIAFEKLSISNANMRQGKRAPDIVDILPSIRARGILVPLIVRPAPEPDQFEIIAGRRRYFSVKTLKEEGGEVGPLPCAIMQSGDDAAALEASLLENIARLDPDPMRQYETFVQLVRTGRAVDEIAATFGLTEAQVKQRLALGNLLPKIREAYRAEEIDDGTIRYLTLATKKQQRDWLALHADERQYAPVGAHLKHWLFGGKSISTKVALFPLADYPGEIVTDLFGDDGYFADADLFWRYQNEAIAAKKQVYLEAGWKTVEVMPQGESFHSWEHEKVRKKQGGKVFIVLSHGGEVQCFEGYLSRKEAAKRHVSQEADVEAVSAKPQRPEVTSNLQAYIDLHRHAAVRRDLAGQPAVAIRLMLAHLMTETGPWQRRCDAPLHRHDGISASLAASPAVRTFETYRAKIDACRGEPGEEERVFSHNDPGEVVITFQQLLMLTDEAVMRLAAMVMADALQTSTPIIELLGILLKVDMASVWAPDDAFFELIRDRDVVTAMLVEIAGEATAATHRGDTAKRQKEIIRGYLAGTNGRPKVENWLPRWIGFPPAHYTERGGLKAVDDHGRVAQLLSQTAAESARNVTAKA